MELVKDQIWNLDGIYFIIIKVYPSQVKIRITGTTTYGSKSIDDRLEILPTTKTYSVEEFTKFIEQYQLKLMDKNEELT